MSYNHSSNKKGGCLKYIIGIICLFIGFCWLLCIVAPKAAKAVKDEALCNIFGIDNIDKDSSTMVTSEVKVDTAAIISTVKVDTAAIYQKFKQLEEEQRKKDDDKNDKQAESKQDYTNNADI